MRGGTAYPVRHLLLASPRDANVYCLPSLIALFRYSRPFVCLSHTQAYKRVEGNQTLFHTLGSLAFYDLHALDAKIKVQYVILDNRLKTSLFSG